MTPARVVVTGAAGRMGRTLVSLVHAAGELRLVGAVERPGGPDAGADAGVLAGVGPVGVTLSEGLEAALQAAPADVVVDFTSGAASAGHARLCAERGVALVVGSTGLEPDEKRAVEDAAGHVPIVMAPNMSVAMNLLFLLVRRAAEVLGEGFDVEIVEAHHRMKRDAPSGTALRLGELVAGALGRDAARDLVHGRSGMVGARGAAEIGIHAVRGGDVVGEHTVSFFGDGERLELTHRAGSRDIFARGALRAARWLVGRPPGLYGMEDVLGL